jgi:hypothetical protein
MDGQIQTSYARKNWSSCILWNCGHDAHAGTLERVNRWRGLWLHQFRWLQDEDIGALPAGWNWLEGTRSSSSGAMAGSIRRRCISRAGSPSMPGYENAAFADEWRAALAEATDRR